MRSSNGRYTVLLGALYSIHGSHFFFLDSHFLSSSIGSLFIRYQSFLYCIWSNQVGFGHIFFHSSRGFFGLFMTCHFIHALCFISFRLGFLSLSLSQQLVHNHRHLCFLSHFRQFIQWSYLHAHLYFHHWMKSVLVCQYAFILFDSYLINR